MEEVDLELKDINTLVHDLMAEVALIKYRLNKLEEGKEREPKKYDPDSIKVPIAK